MLNLKDKITLYSQQTLLNMDGIALKLNVQLSYKDIISNKCSFLITIVLTMFFLTE